jgi:hypothetical protein
MVRPDLHVTILIFSQSGSNDGAPAWSAATPLEDRIMEKRITLVSLAVFGGILAAGLLATSLVVFAGSSDDDTFDPANLPAGATPTGGDNFLLNGECYEWDDGRAEPDDNCSGSAVAATTDPALPAATSGESTVANATPVGDDKYLIDGQCYELEHGQLEPDDDCYEHSEHDDHDDRGGWDDDD